MTVTSNESGLSESLEDYLETILLLSSKSEHAFARVRDIASARNVSAASVSSALKRLADMGLVNYVQREYITLTPKGRDAANRVYARHRILTRFFREILDLPLETAERDACSMEHSLSQQTMDRLVRFFEFLSVSPPGPGNFVELFHKYLFAHDKLAEKTQPVRQALDKPVKVERESLTVYDLKPGEFGKVTKVTASGAIRQRLIDMGVIPGTRVKMERLAPAGEPVWIVLDGIHLSLRRHEAEAVLIEQESGRD